MRELACAKSVIRLLKIRFAYTGPSTDLEEAPESVALLSRNTILTRHSFLQSL